MLSIRPIVYDLLSPLVGMEEIIFADQNSPRPLLPYWTIRVSPSRKVGEDGYGQGPDINGNQDVFGVREATVQLQRFGENSFVVCEDLRDRLFKTTVLDSWRVAKIALYRVGDVLDIAYNLDSVKFEPRAAIDLFIRFGTEILDQIEAIDIVEIGASYVTNQSLSLEEINPDLIESIVVDFTLGV